jgi:hypothetical protein
MDYLAVSDLEGFANRKPDPEIGEEQSYDLGDLGDKWSFFTGKTASLMKRIEDMKTLEDASERIFKGLDTGMADFYAVEKVRENSDSYRVYSEQADEEVEIEKELLKPLLKGKDIESYSPEYQDRLLFFPYNTHKGGYELMRESNIKERYPKAHDYLKRHESELRQRQDGRFDDEEWYRYTNPRNLHHYDKDKICSPYNAFSPSFIFDTTKFHFTTGFAGAYGTITQEKASDFYGALTAILNSTLSQFFMEQTSTPMQGNYFSYEKRFIKNIPLPLIKYTTSEEERATSAHDLIQYADSIVFDSDDQLSIQARVRELSEDEEGIEAIYYTLSELCSDIAEVKGERQQLNLELLDYIGTYSDAETLGQLSGYQPPSGVSDNILAETSKTRDNLRVGEVGVELTNNKMQILATARYKPENEENYETDRWGYTETEPLPAMEFIGLSDSKQELMLEFVPRAVEEGGGFADFRESATKTNSLVDRIKALKLPKVADVEEGLNQYLEAKARDKELQTQLHRAYGLVDKIVYTLYDLNEEEIQAVESNLVNERGK